MIVITRPEIYEGEEEQINALLEAESSFILHLRKPSASAEEYARLLQSVPQRFLNRVCLCDHFELADQFEVGGVHLGGRQPSYSGGRRLRVSKSCHGFSELEHIRDYAYVFLSPIFNSISKVGYNAAFSQDELVAASRSHLINEKVVALGGINAETLPLLSDLGFGGVAVLGIVWKEFSVQRFLHLVELENKYVKK